MASSSSCCGAFDAIIPSASTFGASSSGTKHPPFDVFINHCGQDVKHTLASKIYKSLDDTGLNAFLDNSELKYGDLLPKALEEAMATATICIAIFSEHYAESPWCLAELEYMVKTRKTIIPIFYKVDPSVLRWTVAGAEKTYIEAFRRHEEKNRYAPEALQRWKEALQQVSVCIGGIIKSNDDEEKVVKDVVNRVKELMNTVTLEVAKHPVGLPEVVQHFYHTISLQSADSHVKIIGIWGMGGSGKTTLAKEIFNRRCSHMKWSSFLSNVRDAAGKGLLLEKQKTLLKDLDLKDEQHENLDRGKEILKTRLSRSASVLIVLDDVDHIDQLNALLPSKESFENNIGDESMIMVTTRDKNVLQQWGISESAIYPMKPLEDIHAKQLFCWHAFKQIIPQQGFEDLVEKFLDACAGLPLSLKVLGGQLYGEPDREYWLQTLNRYSQIPHDDIAYRLKVSYDALKKQEQQMFLDAACLFIGQRKSAAIAAWDAEFPGLIGWKTLFNRCLVEEDEDGLIRMHDHLRDLGRDIANGQSPYRLWSPHQIIEISPQQEPIRVRGVASAVGDNCYERQGKIIIKTNQEECSFAPWLGLKIFFGNGEIFSEEQRQLSKDLIWLQCTNFEHKNLPSWLGLKNLRILDLSNSDSLEHLWAADADALLQLRELVIRRCHNFAGSPSSIGNLSRLTRLTIEGCQKLESLPKSLIHLQSLTIKSTPISELSFRSWHMLKSVALWSTKVSNISIGGDSCPALETLDLYSNKDLRELETLPEKLKTLNVRYCGFLKDIRGVRGLNELKSLEIYDCEMLHELPCFAELVSLENLRLKGSSKVEKIEGLEKLRSLRELSIENIDELPSFAVCTSLKKIVLRNCNKLEEIENLEYLKSLEVLRISHCPELKALPVTFLKIRNSISWRVIFS